jgi:hypothetical protein
MDAGRGGWFPPVEGAATDDPGVPLAGTGGAAGAVRLSDGGGAATLRGSAGGSDGGCAFVDPSHPHVSFRL